MCCTANSSRWNSSKRHSTRGDQPTKKTKSDEQSKPQAIWVRGSKPTLKINKEFLAYHPSS